MTLKKNMPGCSAASGCQCIVIEQRQGGSWDSPTGTLATNDLKVGLDNSGDSQNFFFTFDNVALAQGATILTAKITLRTRNSGTNQTVDDCNARITAVDKDQVDLIDGSTDILAYFAAAPRTVNVDWDAMPDFITGNIAHDTPDLTTIVQQIVDRPGWVSGNGIMFVFEDNGSTTNNAVRTSRMENVNPPLTPVFTVTV